MHQQESWGVLVLNELCKVVRHTADISRDQNAPILGSDSKNLWIGSAVRDNTSRSTKID
jgi:hypothetical protein